MMLANRTARARSASGRRPVRAGKEAYSLCMLLLEEGFKLDGWRFEIVGTDLSSEMVEKAKAGIYTQFEVQRGLPITHLVKYFRQVGDKWQLSDKIRQMVTFREYNLLTDLTPRRQFDVVFCRNVLIYFDQPTKGKVLDSIAKLMPPMACSTWAAPKPSWASPSASSRWTISAGSMWSIPRGRRCGEIAVG